MVQYDCWSIPGNTRFDQTLVKIGLDRRQIRNVILEFIGTLLFAFFGGFSSPASAGSGAWANGLILASLVYATDGGMTSFALPKYYPTFQDARLFSDAMFATILLFFIKHLRPSYGSVGQLNPAVTISALLTRNIKPLLALLYIIAQVGGAIVGVVIQIGLLPTTSDQPGCFNPNEVTKSQMFGLELLGTLLFILVVQGVALRFDSFLNVYIDLTADAYGNTGPLAIGLTITGLAFSFSQFTGTAVNPARILAPSIIFRCTDGWTTVIYVLAELAGTVLASAIAFVAYGIKKPAVKMLNQAVEETPLMGETGQSSVNNASLGPREAYNMSRKSMGPIVTQV